MLFSRKYHSPIGMLTIVSSDSHLEGLWIEGQKYFLSTLTEVPTPQENQPILRLVTEWLDQYFCGEKPDPFLLPLAPSGSAFRQRVWKLLCEIPYGNVVTYGELAKLLAKEEGKQHLSPQAVGGAVGHNPISIIIPCHRVIGANGSLTGYAGGLEKKAWLLEHEGVALPFSPNP